MDLSTSQVLAMGFLNSRKNVFLTGAPGTGKSHLIRFFLQKKIPQPPVLASTGAAAILVGGRTFHSFFGLGLMQGGPRATLEKALKNSRLKSRIRKTEELVIDEVSMLSHETLDVAEKICRAIRACEEPWGGIRIVAVGDFAQLPPVSKGKNKQWAFLGEAWARSQFQCIELKEAHRQEDLDFIRLLAKIRNSEIDSEVEAFLEEKTQEASEFDEVPHVFPRRVQTEQFNKAKLAGLEGKLHVYPTKYYGEERYIEILQRDAPVVPLLELKRDALVMLRVNDPKQRFVNGSIAKVYECHEKSIVVDLRGRLIELELFQFGYQDADGKEVAVCENFPISLAYASTIHKTQGASMDRLHADLRNLWEPGQAYVALSRVRSSEGLSLAGWTKSSIISDPMVRSFHAALR